MVSCLLCSQVQSIQPNKQEAALTAAADAEVPSKMASGWRGSTQWAKKLMADAGILKDHEVRPAGVGKQ